MAFGTLHMVKGDYDGSQDSNSPFVPEEWSMETIAAYKANLVLAGNVTVMPHKGNKGDAIHIPVPTRGVAAAKAAETMVTLQAPAASLVTVTINKHYEYSYLLEDVMAIQGLDSFQRFYTDDSGYALGRQVDFDLHVLGTGLQGGTLDTSPGTPAANTLAYDAAVIGSDGSTLWAESGAGNGAALADAGIRKMIQTLDDVDTPQNDRVIVVPPVEKKNLLGLARFTEQAFVGETGNGNSIRNGQIGNIYGTPVLVSTNCPTVYDSGATNSFRVGMIFHKAAFALAEQLGVRVQRDYQQAYLGTLYTSDTLYGTAELRNDAGVAFVVPA